MNPEIAHVHKTKFCANIVDVLLRTDNHCLVACGMYQLSAPGCGSVRSGGVELYNLTTNISSMLFDNVDDVADTAGIFDFKRIYHEDTNNILLLCALSDGSVALFDIVHNGSNYELKANMSANLRSAGTILTCCDSTEMTNGEAIVVVGDNCGTLSSVTISNCGFSIDRSWDKAHKAKYSEQGSEVWVTAIDTRRGFNNEFYSGGDDCALKMWDLRQAEPVFTLIDGHKGGVLDVNCCNRKSENIVATGSYDDCVRIWDSRNWIKPLSQMNVGGGAWKLQWDPWGLELLLVASMYNGWTILDYKAGFNQVATAAQCTSEGHNLVYGVDWLNCGNNCTNFQVISSTFYDASVRIYNVNAGIPA